jgi:hypothetical protein
VAQRPTPLGALLRLPEGYPLTAVERLAPPQEVVRLNSA